MSNLALAPSPRTCTVCGGHPPMPVHFLRAGAPLSPTDPRLPRPASKGIPSIGSTVLRMVEGFRLAGVRRQEEAGLNGDRPMLALTPLSRPAATSTQGTTAQVVPIETRKKIGPARLFAEADVVAIPEERLRADRNRERKHEGLRRHRCSPDSTLQSSAGKGGRARRNICAGY